MFRRQYFGRGSSEGATITHFLDAEPDDLPSLGRPHMVHALTNEIESHMPKLGSARGSLTSFSDVKLECRGGHPGCSFWKPEWMRKIAFSIVGRN